MPEINESNTGKTSADVGKSDSFSDLLCGHFEPDSRQVALHDRLMRYYEATPDHMPNREALPHWMAFKKWCNDSGYTQVEINKAKRDVAHLTT